MLADKVWLYPNHFMTCIYNGSQKVCDTQIGWYLSEGHNELWLILFVAVHVSFWERSKEWWPSDTLFDKHCIVKSGYNVHTPNRLGNSLIEFDTYWKYWKWNNCGLEVLWSEKWYFPFLKIKFLKLLKVMLSL